MHRFFAPPSSFHGRQLTLDGALAHQIANVLRLRAGERILVLDNSGWEMLVELDVIGPDRVGGQVLKRSLAGNEPAVKVVVYQSLLKGDRFEYSLQKCTELGASAFVPLITSRTVVTTIADGEGARQRRWQRIVTEAAELSGRARIPHIGPAMLFPAACQLVAGLSIIPWEEERVLPLRQVLRNCFLEEDGMAPRAARPFSINLFIGPEGGFTPEEVAMARRYEIVPVTMGPRVFRSETAAVAATTAVLYEAGEMDSRVGS